MRSFSVSLIYLVLAVPCTSVWDKHSCMSFTFSTATLNGTCSPHFKNSEKVWKQSAYKLIYQIDVLDQVRVAVVAPILTQTTPLCRLSFRWLWLFQTCVLIGKFSWNIKLTGKQSVVQYRICPGITFFFLVTILLLKFILFFVICISWHFFHVL